MITILGADGFIGSHLVAHLRGQGHAFQAIGRHGAIETPALGHVIDCVGITGDWMERPFDMIDAHVGRLAQLLRSESFDSYLYLSSTRLYAPGSDPAREDDALRLDSAAPDALYNLSKAAGEALILSIGSRGRVARLATIYGRGHRHTFLASIIAEGQANGIIRLHSALQSERDYLDVEDTVNLLVKIALSGRHRLYNIASGTQVQHARILDRLFELRGWRTEVDPDAPVVRGPAIDVSRIREEFGFRPRALLDLLPTLVAA